MTKLTPFALLAALAAFTAGPVQADSIDLASGSGTTPGANGSFTGALSSSGGTLSLSITNTSATIGLRLTAVGFVGLQGVTASGFSSSSGNFQAISGFKMKPFPSGDFGASTSSNWLGQGGGHVQAGLLTGDSATFSWSLAGSGSAAAFADAGIYVRFKGDDRYGVGTSDKVPAVPGEPVPEPSTLALLALGGLGAAAARRRRRRAEAADPAEA